MQNAALRTLSLSLVALAAAACSSSNTPADGSTDAAAQDGASPTDGAAMDGAAMDGGAEDAAADGTTPADAGPEVVTGNTVRSGDIGISQITLGPTHTFVGASETAQFLNVGDDAGVSYTARTEGACGILRVVLPSSGVGSSAVSAGSVTIHGGTGADLTLAPDATNQYMSANQSTPRWQSADMITVTGAGATVPAFSTMVSFPSLIDVTGTAPAATAGMLTIDRTVPFTATWSGTAAGNVSIAIVQSVMDASTGTTTSVEIGCTFPLGDHMGVVPASVLGELSPLAASAAGSGTLVVIGASNRQRVMAGDYTVNVTATAGAFLASATVQ